MQSAWLGEVVYEEALRLQRLLVDRRVAEQSDDVLLTLTHDRVYTAGRHADLGRNLLGTRPDIRVVEVDRGGDLTYHGPGQLVGYPIFDLRPHRCDVHQYVRDLESALIIAVLEFGIYGCRVHGHTGVWVGPTGLEEKLAAIGVRISRWITSHGFALNVSVDLQHFRYIVPCGIPDRGVTSIEKLIGRGVPMREAEDAVELGFRRMFGV